MGGDISADLAPPKNEIWVNEIRLRCVEIAPLGRPVVPDVNMIAAASSSSMATVGNGASGR